MGNSKNFGENWIRVDGIATGGQGTTIKGVNKSNPDIIAAIKILNRQNDLERRARMHREAIALETIEHPNIPKVLDLNTENWKDFDFKLFLAMEFIEGKTLNEIDFQTLSFDNKLELVLKIAEIIDYFHKRGIVHRDLKPDNIILRNNNFLDPIIIDFGISFNFNEKDDDNLTPDGQHIGNRFLILPEQKVGEVSKRDPRSDVTQLVGLFFFMITNEFPVILEDQNQLRPHQRQSSKTTINSFKTNVIRSLNYIFDLGFNTFIENRWQTISSLVNQLQRTRILNNSNFESTPNHLALIKSISKVSGYKDLKRNSEVIENAIQMSRNFYRGILGEIGPEWSGGMSFVKSNYEGFDNNHLIRNTILNIQIDTFIKPFVSGNEIIIHSRVRTKNDLDTVEVFRHPIINNIDWSLLKVELRNHYFKFLSKEVENLGRS